MHQPRPLSGGLRAPQGRRPFPSLSPWSAAGQRCPRAQGRCQLSQWRSWAHRPGWSLQGQPASQRALLGTCAGITGEETLSLQSGSLPPMTEVIPAGGMTTGSLSSQGEGRPEKEPHSSAGITEISAEECSWAQLLQPPSVLCCSQASDISPPTFFQPNACPSLAPMDAPQDPSRAPLLH